MSIKLISEVRNHEVPFQHHEGSICPKGLLGDLVKVFNGSAEGPKEVERIINEEIVHEDNSYLTEAEKQKLLRTVASASHTVRHFGSGYRE